jgi:hypothetical protein
MTASTTELCDDYLAKLSCTEILDPSEYGTPGLYHHIVKCLNPWDLNQKIQLVCITIYIRGWYIPGRLLKTRLHIVHPSDHNSEVHYKDIEIDVKPNGRYERLLEIWNGKTIINVRPRKLNVDVYYSIHDDCDRGESGSSPETRDSFISLFCDVVSIRKPDGNFMHSMFGNDISPLTLIRMVHLFRIDVSPFHGGIESAEILFKKTNVKQRSTRLTFRGDANPVNPKDYHSIFSEQRDHGVDNLYTLSGHVKLSDELIACATQNDNVYLHMEYTFPIKSEDMGLDEVIELTINGTKFAYRVMDNLVYSDSLPRLK